VPNETDGVTARMPFTRLYRTITPKSCQSVFQQRQSSIGRVKKLGSGPVYLAATKGTPNATDSLSVNA